MKLLDDAVKKVKNNNFLNILKSILFNEKIIIVTERSILTDKNIFAKMLYDSNAITDLEMKIYDEWSKYFSEKNDIDGIIYLQNTPKCSKNRIDKRGRPEETSISLDYLTSLHEYHNNWLTSSDSYSDNIINKKHIPILILNVEDDFEAENTDSIERSKNHMIKIKKFIN